MPLPRLCRPAGHVAAQRQDVADAGTGEAPDDLAELGTAVAHGGQVADRGDRGLARDPLDDTKRAVPGGTSGAVGDRDEGGLQRLEFANGLPELALALVGLRWEEFE